MRPIFNEKVTEKLCLWVCKQCINVLFTVEKSTKPALDKKKKKAENTNLKRKSLIQTKPYSFDKRSTKTEVSLGSYIDQYS